MTPSAGRCHCGSEWFTLRGRAMDPPIAEHGVVTLSSAGDITGYRGGIRCAECSEQWFPEVSTPSTYRRIDDPRVWKIYYLEIDKVPVEVTHSVAPSGNCLIDEYGDLPEVFATALEALITEGDSAACWRCGVSVGYIRHEDRAVGSQRWRPTYLARDDVGLTAWLCADCCPDVPTGPSGPSNWGRSPIVAQRAVLYCKGKPVAMCASPSLASDLAAELSARRATELPRVRTERQYHEDVIEELRRHLAALEGQRDRLQAEVTRVREHADELACGSGAATKG